MISRPNVRREIHRLEIPPSIKPVGPWQQEGQFDSIVVNIWAILLIGCVIGLICTLL